jgi:hypothetical protein
MVGVPKSQPTEKAKTKSDNTDEFPLMVLDTTPLNGATDVSLDSLVTSSFNKRVSGIDLDKKTFTVKRTSQVNNSAPVNSPQEPSDLPGSITLSPDGKTAIFRPKENFSPNTKYIAKIEGVKDTEGKTLAFAVSWSFTTISVSEHSDTI